MRPLILHTSALSDAEYKFYTASLNDLSVSSDLNEQFDIFSDDYFEHVTVGVREVRAWMRGRYLNMESSDIDAVSVHNT